MCDIQMVEGCIDSLKNMTQIKETIFCMIAKNLHTEI